MNKEKKKRRIFGKYLIALLIFVVWMIFFDTNNVVHQYKLQQKLNNLQEDTAYYRKETDRYTQMTKALSSDMEMLEKLGRDEYRMKRDNEVVYIIQE